MGGRKRGEVDLEYGVSTVARLISSLHKILRRNIPRLELYIFRSRRRDWCLFYVLTFSVSRTILADNPGGERLSLRYGVFFHLITHFCGGTKGLKAPKTYQTSFGQFKAFPKCYFVHTHIVRIS